MEISGYSLERKLGQGGMAVVYLATQDSLQRHVALKVLNPLLSDDPRFSERFLREGRILASLNHANIITIHDIGIDGGYHYISMEYVGGADLKARLKQGISPAAAVQYLRTTAQCLGFAHGRGIVHRDVKPANILFRGDGTLLLSDFGIAKQLDGSSDITLTGTPMGSPNYLSPEQAQGLEVGVTTDIYSLGVLFFEMLAGHRPFKGANAVDTIVEQLRGEVPELPPAVRQFQPLVEAMLAKRPIDRLQSVDEVLDALDDVYASVIDVTEPVLGVETTAHQADRTSESAAREGTTLVESTETPEHGATAHSTMPWYLGVGVLVLIVGGGIFFQFEASPPAAPVSGTDSASAAAIPAPKPVEKPEDESPPAPLAESPETVSTLAPDNAEVKRLLDLGATAFSAGRLTRPQGQDAAGFFLEVLLLQSANDEARAGLKKIANRYAELAATAIDAEEYSAASEYIRRGQAVEFSHPMLVELRARLIAAGKWRMEPQATTLPEESATVQSKPKLPAAEIDNGQSAGDR